MWCFDRCYYETREIIHDNQVITLKPYQFIFGRRVCSEETGLTDNEIRHQQNLYERLFYLKKSTNKTTNRFTIYEWSTEVFSQSHHQQNNQYTTNKQPTEPPQTRTKEPTDLKEPTELTSLGLVGSFSCLQGLGLVPSDLAKLEPFEEVDIIRAVAVLKEQRKPVDSNIAFLLKAIANKWQPKSNPKIELSDLAKSNREKLFSYADQARNDLKLRDITIKDCIDHAMYGVVKLPYESPNFKELVKEARIKYNMWKLPPKPHVDGELNGNSFVNAAASALNLIPNSELFKK